MVGSHLRHPKVRRIAGTHVVSLLLLNFVGLFATTTGYAQTATSNGQTDIEGKDKETLTLVAATVGVLATSASILSRNSSRNVSRSAQNIVGSTRMPVGISARITETAIAAFDDGVVITTLPLTAGESVSSDDFHAIHTPITLAPPVLVGGGGVGRVGDDSTATFHTTHSPVTLSPPVLMGGGGVGRVGDAEAFHAVDSPITLSPPVLVAGGGFGYVGPLSEENGFGLPFQSSEGGATGAVFIDGGSGGGVGFSSGGSGSDSFHQGSILPANTSVPEPGTFAVALIFAAPLALIASRRHLRCCSASCP